MGDSDWLLLCLLCCTDGKGHNIGAADNKRELGSFLTSQRTYSVMDIYQENKRLWVINRATAKFLSLTNRKAEQH